MAPLDYRRTEEVTGGHGQQRLNAGILRGVRLLALPSRGSLLGLDASRRNQNNRMKVSKMTRAAIATALAVAGILLPVGSALASLNSITPAVHNDPNYPNLVFAAWLNALGCPTNGPYPCYPPVDLDDTKNEGLLLSKQGSSGSGAEAYATLNGVAGTPVPFLAVVDPLSGIGFDIRKEAGALANTGATLPPGGSHCGFVSPRIEVVTDNDTYDFVCADAAAMKEADLGWTRLRWSMAQGVPHNPSTPPGIGEGDTIRSARVVLDEGQDGPDDFFGLAVLDNFFVFDPNSMVGMGEPQPPPFADEDHGAGEDKDHDGCQFRDSPSHPDQGSMRYSDKSKRMSVTSVNGLRSIAYTGTALTGRCVSFTGDAYMNGKSGYGYTFQACSLPTGIGNFTISVTGPAGFLYQKAAVLTSGSVYLHQ